MKKAFGFLTLMLIGFTANAQDGPKIQFKQETINYGDVVKGVDDGVRVFEFTNTGNAPLIITDVKSSCGCTVPSKPSAPIMPGKSDKITVQYNMSPGPISKTITVQSNAVNAVEGMTPLRIKGNVIVKEEKSPLEKKKAMPNSN